MSDILIREAGAYPDIDGDLYHDTEILDSPSVSSSGLKLIEARSPYHYWFYSNLNPKRPTRKPSKALDFGKAAHDVVLIGGDIRSRYHVLPEGFNAQYTKIFADAIEARDHAVSKGKRAISLADYDKIMGMAEAIERNELARALLTAGTPEMTLAARDPETGIWMRARPDVLPDTTEIVPDLKTAADASLDVYERAATRFGYFQSAAHYLDVIELIYGEAKRRFVLVTVEKDPPYCVTIDHLDDDDIAFARLRNRHALNRFAECLKTGVWPAYTTPEKPIRPLQMTGYERKLIEQAIDRGELSYA